jgi:AraC-like DNA-binding protein
VNERHHAGEIWERLVALPVARQYRTAFETATGLTLKLLPAAGLDELERVSGPFCAMIGACSMTPIGCPRKARIVRREPETHGAVTCVCCVGDVTEVVVPVFIGATHAGNVVVGPFSLRPPTARDISEMERLVWRRDPSAAPGRFEGLCADLRGLPVITTAKYRAAATLAGVFAQHLSESGNRLLLEAAGQQSQLLQRIQRAFKQHGTDRLPLSKLSREVGRSPSRLCKQFKKETGLTLGEYRLRRRIERAKELLLDHHFRVCEAAFEAGFGSIPHFNRAFRRVVGCAPSEFRRQVAVANQAKHLTIHA